MDQKWTNFISSPHTLQISGYQKHNENERDVQHMSKLCLEALMTTGSPEGSAEPLFIWVNNNKEIYN